MFLLALVLLSVGAVPAHAQPDATETTHFFFKAPRDITGLFAARLRFEWGGENTCSGVLAASGPRVSINPVYYWSEWKSATTFDWTSLYRASNLQIHAGGTIDSRSLEQTSGNWGFAPFFSGKTFTDYLEVTYRAFDVAAWNSSVTDAPVWIELTCERPFTVAGIEAGTDGRSFTRDSLHEGVGASVDYLVLPSATVSAGDKLRHTFDEASVLFSIYSYQGQNGTSIGRLTLKHPQGTESWEPSGNPFYTDQVINFAGGPGAYELTLDRVGAGSVDIFLGSLVGLDAVDCLEQTIGFACPEPSD